MVSSHMVTNFFRCSDLFKTMVLVHFAKNEGRSLGLVATPSESDLDDIMAGGRCASKKGHDSSPNNPWFSQLVNTGDPRKHSSSSTCQFGLEESLPWRHEVNVCLTVAVLFLQKEYRVLRQKRRGIGKDKCVSSDDLVWPHYRKVTQWKLDP